MFTVISNDLSDVCGFVCNFFSLISDIIYLGFSLFSLWVWLNIYQFCLSFQRFSSYFLIFSIVLVSVPFISALSFTISFLQLTLAFIYSSFARPFKYSYICLFELFLFTEVVLHHHKLLS